MKESLCQLSFRFMVERSNLHLYDPFGTAVPLLKVPAKAKLLIVLPSA